MQKGHEFECCDRTQRFDQISQFRDHLRDKHDATLGDWTERLVDACLSTEVVKLVREESSRMRGEYRESMDTNASEEGTYLPASISQLGGIDVKDHLLDKYGAVLVGSDLSGCPRELMNYIRLWQIMERKKSNKRVLEVIQRKVDRSLKPALDEILKTKLGVERGLGLLEADLERARRSCWMQGFDLDFIEEIFPSCKPFERESVGPCENLAVMWNEIPHEEVQAWSTKRGRINYWLLQNLIASSEESKRHRSYLQNGEDLDETQWSQLVLQFWLADEAAIFVESGSSSTNVAVDNDGLCHSARDLQEALALRKRRGFDSESESLESPEPRKRVKVSFIDESP